MGTVAGSTFLRRWLGWAASCLAGLVMATGCGATDHNASSEDSGGAPSQMSGEDCSPQPLERACSTRPCPASVDDVPLDCDLYKGALRYATQCGGTAVVLSYGFGATTWYFGADGQLTGDLEDGDVLKSCSDGTVSASSTYGATCPFVGEPTDLCADLCGGPPLECGDDPSCPPTYADLPLEACDQGGSVTSNATTCGGTSATISTSDGSRYYCFDGLGRLIGMGNQADDGARTVTRGTACRLEGMAKNRCSG